MRILITGASGNVGTALLRGAGHAGPLLCPARRRLGRSVS